MASHLFCAMAVRVDGGQTSLHGTLGKDHHLIRTALRTALLSLTLIAVSSAPASALETIFGNTGLHHNGLELPGGTGPPGVPFYDWLAQGFTMSSTAYELKAVQIGLQFPTTAAYNSISVGLYSSSGGNPNTGAAPIATFTSPTFTTSPTEYQFDYTGPQLMLAANQTYWLVVKYVGSSDLFSWYFATAGELDAPVAQNGSGISYAGTKAYDTLGAPPVWMDFSTAPNDFRGLRYSVITVPEPSTYALGAIGTLMMGAVARRKSRKSASA